MILTRKSLLFAFLKSFTLIRNIIKKSVEIAISRDSIKPSLD